MKIFLIDDDAEEAELFAEAVQRTNTAVNLESYNSGLEALKALHILDEKPTLIFLDLNMPMFSGLDVLKELRSNTTTSSIPVIIYSTTISKRAKEETEPYNVKKYLQKPEDFGSLCRQLSEVLNEI